MNTARKYYPFLASALLMALVLCFIYPHYQYYIDPDGTAYLTISRRYAQGDWAKAVNGYWSPWACWLTAGLMLVGIPAIPASVIINALGAAGVLFIAQSFFLRFGIERFVQWVMSVTLALFLCYAVFWQSFDDLWECFFLLSALRMMLVSGFVGRPLLWVAMGLVGALAYFAKAYSFPFFILSTVCCVYFLCRDNKKQWLLISGTSCAVMFICALPWIWALHSKYGIWTTSTAGPLNTSWYLVGHPYFKPSLGGVLPPVYPDSPYFWEDPYMANGDTPHFWSSWELFGRQGLKIGQNGYKLLYSMLQLSVFFPFIAFLACLLLYSKKWKAMFSPDVSIVALSFLLFPLGYVLVNFEARYLWYMLPLGMLMGGMAMQLPFIRNRLQIMVCFGSFLLYPAWCVYKLYDAGKDEYKWAQELKQHNIKGSFTGVFPQGKYSQSAARLAYFSGNSLYCLPPDGLGDDELLAQMKLKGIKYYIVYGHAGAPALPKFFKLAEAKISFGAQQELKVFELK